ncbi:MAG TPA: EutN/CcmL family microcompartment protein [Candidatus Binatia bacterium]|nr:EutN/CcmL family microcompartment protein [Candidatus Binatia bacterium]
MDLARVAGSVVCSVKEHRLTGSKLLIVAPAKPDGSPSSEPPFVAVDLVGAGEGEVVVVSRGSPAARTVDPAGATVDAVIVGIVDSVQLAGRVVYAKD